MWPLCQLLTEKTDSPVQTSIIASEVFGCRQSCVALHKYTSLRAAAVFELPLVSTLIPGLTNTDN